MKKLLLGLLMGCLTCVVFADKVALKDGHPESYYVKEGDTLWDISNVFLSDPWLWPEIWHVNPQISNPHLIYPGDKLALVEVEESVGGNQNAAAGNNAKSGKRTVRKLTITERAPVKLRPGDGKITPKVRIEAVSAAIPAIPLEKINAFLTKSRVVELDILDDAPYVIAGDSRRILSGAGDKMYARGEFKEDEKIYGIYRAGETYIDPETKETLGLQALDIGSGRIVSQQEDVATLVLNRTNEEVRINDRLLPNEERKVTATFHPKAPKDNIKGRIISVENGVANVGAMDIVAINRGERDGLLEGDVLAISQAGEVVNDYVKKEQVQLPDVRAGILIVFRTFEKMAYGLVVSAERPLKVGDKVHSPNS